MIVKPSEFPYVERCPFCEGTGTHWYNPDYPMGDCGERAPEPCLTCNERGWLIPSGWIEQCVTNGA